MGHKANWKLPAYHNTPEYWEEHDRWREAYNTCSECGSLLRIANDSPIELEAADEDDLDDDDDDDEEEDDDDEDDDEEDEDDEDEDVSDED